MINFIVGIMSVMAAGLVVVWIARPSFRKWIEQPKYTVLETIDAFDRPITGTPDHQITRSPKGTVLESDRRFKETKQENNY